MTISLLVNLMDFIDHYQNKKSDFNKLLLEISNEVNEKLPIMVDSETKFDSTTVLTKKVFQYNYTAINISKNEIDTKKLKTQLYQNILDKIKTDDRLKILRDNHVTFVYLYKDRDDYEILKLTYSKKDYK
jgi:hypothetical protein